MQPVRDCFEYLSKLTGGIHPNCIVHEPLLVSFGKALGNLVVLSKFLWTERHVSLEPVAQITILTNSQAVTKCFNHQSKLIGVECRLNHMTEFVGECSQVPCLSECDNRLACIVKRSHANSFNNLIKYSG